MAGSGSAPARFWWQLQRALLPGRAGAVQVLAGVASLLLCTFPAVSQSSPGATVHGTVINEVTRHPIARALVTLQQYGAAMLTDNDGNFSFDAVPVGQTTLVAKRPGFVSDNSQQAVTISTSGSNQVMLEMTPQSALTGEIALGGDDAADGIRLQLLQRQIVNGRGTWSSSFHTTEVSEDGHFRFGNLTPGTYLVHAGASMDPGAAAGEAGTTEGGTTKPSIRSGYVPAFYPGVREIGEAAEIPLAPGQQADIQLALTREPYYPIVIPVANGSEERGLSFQVSSESFLGLPARYSAEDGLVHMELPNGHYTLRAQGYGLHPLSGEREFDVAGSAELTHVLIGPSITLVPVNHIPVTVRAELTHGSPQQPEDGSVLTALNQINLDLQREGGRPGGRGGRPSLQNDETSRTTGVSQLQNVLPGRYWVNARAYNGYVAAMTSGGVDLLENPLVVGADGSASAIEITVRDDTASFSAALGSSLQTSAGQPGQAARTIYLRLIPRTGAGTDRTAAFDADGTAALSGLVPGEYYAYATTTRQPLEFRNPRVLAAIGRESQAVTLAADGSTRLTIETLSSTTGGAQ